MNLNIITLRVIITMFCLLANIMLAQTDTRVFKEARLNSQNILKVQVNDGCYNIGFLTAKIIQTTFIPRNEVDTQISQAVVLVAEDLKLKFISDSNHVEFSSQDFKVIINKKPFQISYYYKDKVVISEKEGYKNVKHEVMSSVKENIISDSIQQLSFNLQSEEILFGGGARALGMNRRGRRLPLYNKAHYG